MEICPDCGSDLTRRIPRAWWMRLLFPSSVRIVCERCGERTLIRRPKPGDGAGTSYSPNGLTNLLTGPPHLAPRPFPAPCSRKCGKAVVEPAKPGN
jgi:hypothetical protein